MPKHPSCSQRCEAGKLIIGKDVLINLGALFPIWPFSLIFNGKDRMQWKIKTEDAFLVKKYQLGTIASPDDHSTECCSQRHKEAWLKNCRSLEEDLWI